MRTAWAPRPTGGPQHQRPDDDADRADGVRRHLEERALDVERLACPAPQQGEGDEVGGEADDRDDQHRTGQHLDRRGEPAHRLDQHVHADTQQQHGVGQGGEDLEAVEPERPVAALAAAVGELDRGQGHAQPDHVGQHVAGVGEQRQRTREHPGHQLEHGHPGQQHERGGERPLVPGPGAVRSVRVHPTSLAVATGGGNVRAGC
jgi:hypothetical protein